MVERPKNHWKKQWGQWSAGQKTFNRIFSTLAKPLKTIDPNGVPEKNSFHSIALKNDSALQWVEVSPSPGMIYNPGCVAAHLASKKLSNIFWIQLSSIWSDNAIPRWKNNNYSEKPAALALSSLFWRIGQAAISRELQRFENASCV